jgi:hypothetical protein
VEVEAREWTWYCPRRTVWLAWSLSLGLVACLACFDRLAEVIFCGVPIVGAIVALLMTVPKRVCVSPQEVTIQRLLIRTDVIPRECISGVVSTRSGNIAICRRGRRPTTFAPRMLGVEPEGSLMALLTLFGDPPGKQVLETAVVSPAAISAATSEVVFKARSSFCWTVIGPVCAVALVLELVYWSSFVSFVTHLPLGLFVLAGFGALFVNTFGSGFLWVWATGGPCRALDVDDSGLRLRQWLRTRQVASERIAGVRYWWVDVRDQPRAEAKVVLSGGHRTSSWRILERHYDCPPGVLVGVLLNRFGEHLPPMICEVPSTNTPSNTSQEKAARAALE